MNAQEATKLIAEELAKAQECLDKAVAISEASGVVFSLPWGGEGTNMRGLGGDYVPTTASDQDKGAWGGYSLHGYGEEGWQPSAGNC